VPWKPKIESAADTQHFNDYDENTDTENKELDDDLFQQLLAF